MSLWDTFFKKIPVDDGRAVAARIAVRFVFCTFPYFTLALLMHAYGDDRLLTGWIAAWMLAIPVLGGMIDGYRLRHRTKAVATPLDVL